MTDDIFDKYYNKMQVLYRLNPGVQIDEKWIEIMSLRKQKSIALPLLDQENRNLFIVLTENLKKSIVSIDEATNKIPYDNIDPEIRGAVIYDVLIDEAYKSSLIEGAHTTKKKTKKMIEENLIPKDKSEKMVLNNYNALKYVMNNKSTLINENIILEIYKIITEGTLSKEDMCDKYRKDQNEVLNQMNEVIYTPPKAENVQWMMDDLLKFLHSDSTLIHPVLKAILFQYYFVYIHPFHDGNGRTARALTYMYLIQNGYSFFQYFSISSMIADARAGYYKAIKDAEDYESDTTYFALFYSKMIIDSIMKMHGDFLREYAKDAINKEIQNRGIFINKRQEKAINFMLKYSKAIDISIYTKKINKVAQETARKDLNELIEFDLLEKKLSGRKHIYSLKNMF